jgi:hypothetical protein
MGKLDKECIVEINYKDIKHGLKILNKIKTMDLNYYTIYKTYFFKNIIVLHMIEKEYPYCGWGNTWYNLELNERFILRIKYKTANSYSTEKS